MAGQGLEAKILSLAQAIQYGNANGNAPHWQWPE